MLIHSTYENIKDKLDKGLKIVVFHAKWCGACRMLAPVLEQVAEEGETIIKIDVDEDRTFAAANNVSSIPYILIYKDGVIVDKLLGYRPYEQLKEEIAKHK
ncbi:thioredoxin family protein [Mycoplasmopsis gallinacea]|uniref:Thioredoxin n=1 Tax=Mycoplasmopsis gallinacea TaxID=29556 RepID=A0A449A2T1_9BACT|nr:thioredoxin domain-containing protein [Mycoplasmopsis gallinacea]VEU58561.1 Thioredoxin [Mycoplasmopsis gallinacea]